MPRKLLHKGVCWKGNWPCRGVAAGRVSPILLVLL